MTDTNIKFGEMEQEMGDYSGAAETFFSTYQQNKSYRDTVFQHLKDLRNLSKDNVTNRQIDGYLSQM